jgi:hypothetical protein
VPIKHLLRELLDGPALDPTSLAGRLDETLQVVTITPAGIDPAGFAPLGE